MSDGLSSTEAVVKRTGWVFNNRRGDDLTTDDFVASGDVEVEVFRQLFGLGGPDDEQRSIVEIGAGIGRMTCALTRHYGSVYACDLDPGFLERCRDRGLGEHELLVAPKLKRAVGAENFVACLFHRLGAKNRASGGEDR